MKYLCHHAGDLCSLLSAQLQRPCSHRILKWYKIISLHLKQTTTMNCYPAFQYHCFLWYQHYPPFKWYLTLHILQFCFLVEKKSSLWIQGIFWMQWGLPIISGTEKSKNQLDWSIFRDRHSSIAKFIANSMNKSTASRWPRLKIFSQPEKKGKTLCKSNVWEDYFHLMKKDRILCKIPKWQVGSWTRWSQVLSNWTILFCSTS